MLVTRNLADPMNTALPRTNAVDSESDTALLYARVGRRVAVRDGSALLATLAGLPVAPDGSVGWVTGASEAPTPLFSDSDGKRNPDLPQREPLVYS